MVMHWPGSSWPPTSTSEHLFVIDGTIPEGIGMGTGEVEHEYIAAANATIPEVTYRAKAGTTQMMCVVTVLEVKNEATFDGGDALDVAVVPEIKLVRFEPDPCRGTSQATVTLDASLSPIKDASKWNFAIPEDAKELTILFSKGLIRRPALLLKNDEGKYDTLKNI